MRGFALIPRGAVAFLIAVGLAAFAPAFLLALAPFFRAAALALPPLSAWRPVGRRDVRALFANTGRLGSR